MKRSVVNPQSTQTQTDARHQILPSSPHFISTEIDPIQKVLSETDPTNFGFRVGVMLRKAYDYLSSKISIGLPIAEAATAPSENIVLDQKFLDLLDSTDFHYHSEKLSKKEVKKRQELVIENTKENFKALAREGEWTKAMISAALKLRFNLQL